MHKTNSVKAVSYNDGSGSVAIRAFVAENTEVLDDGRHLELAAFTSVLHRGGQQTGTYS